MKGIAWRNVTDNHSLADFDSGRKNPSLDKLFSEEEEAK
jgi:hypothetical protein